MPAGPLLGTTTYFQDVQSESANMGLSKGTPQHGWFSFGLPLNNRERKYPRSKKKKGHALPSSFHMLAVSEVLQAPHQLLLLFLLCHDHGNLALGLPSSPCKCPESKVWELPTSMIPAELFNDSFVSGKVPWGQRSEPIPCSHNVDHRTAENSASPFVCSISLASRAASSPGKTRLAGSPVDQGPTWGRATNRLQ